MTEPPTVTVRDVLRLVWEADRYPILGNADWRAAADLEAEALALAGDAAAEPGDPPEFAGWLEALRSPQLRNNQREAIMKALYDLFDPENGHTR